MTRALEAERAELLALADQMQALGYSEFGDCLSFDAYNLILAALRLAAAPLGDVREALWNTDGDAVPRNRSVLVRWPSGEHDICYRNDCEGVCIDTWRYATGPMRGTQAGWPKAWCFIDAALDALVPAGGEGKALRLLDQFERDATIGVGVASLLRSALAPQNAGGERHKPFVPATEDEFNELMDNGHNTGGKTYYRPSESTPAPAKCGCGEFCQDLGVDSGCRYISNPPAPADDEPLSARDHAMIDQAWENYKAALPVATVINDNQPGRTAIIEITIDPPTLPVGTKLYAAPKMVEVPPAKEVEEAIKRIIRGVYGVGADPWGGVHQGKSIEKAAHKIAALLRDSNETNRPRLDQIHSWPRRNYVPTLLHHQSRGRRARTVERMPTPRSPR